MARIRNDTENSASAVKSLHLASEKSLPKRLLIMDTNEQVDQQLRDLQGSGVGGDANPQLQRSIEQIKMNFQATVDKHDKSI